MFFSSFTSLLVEANPKISTRVRLLILAMFENRASGWAKSESEDREILIKESESQKMKLPNDRKKMRK